MLRCAAQSGGDSFLKPARSYMHRFYGTPSTRIVLLPLSPVSDGRTDTRIAVAVSFFSHSIHLKCYDDAAAAAYNVRIVHAFCSVLTRHKHLYYYGLYDRWWTDGTLFSSARRLPNELGMMISTWMSRTIDWNFIESGREGKKERRGGLRLWLASS